MFTQEKLFFCPGYQRFFSHAARIFGVDRRPTDLQLKPCKKTSGTDRCFLLSPLTFEFFLSDYISGTQGSFFGHVIGPLLPNVVWSRLLNTGLIPFCVFHGPRQIRTNLANTQQSSLLQAQSINHKCYTFTKPSAFQVIMIIITCIRCVNNVFIIYASFANNSHMFLAVIFLTTTTDKVCFKKDSASFPSCTSHERCGSTGQVAYYGTTNEPQFLKFTPFVLTICPDFSLIVH